MGTCSRHNTLISEMNDFFENVCERMIIELQIIHTYAFFANCHMIFPYSIVFLLCLLVRRFFHFMVFVTRYFNLGSFFLSFILLDKSIFSSFFRFTCSETSQQLDSSCSFTNDMQFSSEIINEQSFYFCKHV